MMQRDVQTLAEAAALHFCGGREIRECAAYGSGHINDTYRVMTEEKNGGDPKRILVQRVNTEIFTEPVLLMENILRVTEHLRQKIRERGGDPERETLTVIPAADGKPYYRDDAGNFWRCYRFLNDAFSLDQVDSAEMFYRCALAFGDFQQMLADFPAECLHETIAGFHDTAARLEALERAVREDVCGRAAEVGAEIAFVREREALAHVLGDLQRKGELPLRVTHNDTKLNNVMLDAKTRKGLCVVDLDTVLPGLAVHDFGDSIRFGASTAAEDERDLTKVSCDMELFEAYTRGYLESCGSALTEREIELLPVGAAVMTYECGIRFLTDYLQGDIYFKTHRPGQNLDRCRTQLKLVADMEQKRDIMEKIVRRYQPRSV